MSLETMLVVGLILCLFCVPAILAAWSESRPLYFRLGVFVVALGLIGWPYLQSPAEYGPENWFEIALTVVAPIIP